LLLGLWPAVGEADYPVFAEALYEYNREAGAAFAQDQGGVYVAPEVEGLVDTIRAWGILAAGQSSWGPTVFAVTPDPPAADKLAQRLRESTPSAEFVTVAAADNTGAVLTRCG
jgi:predicted sugar kinase